MLFGLVGMRDEYVYEKHDTHTPKERCQPPEKPQLLNTDRQEFNERYKHHHPGGETKGKGQKPGSGFANEYPDYASDGSR